MAYTLTSEQAPSLARALETAGVRHGDTVEADIAVGTVASQEGSHVAFCSSVVRARQVIKAGSARERGEPIKGEVTFDSPEMICKAVAGRQGVAVIRARVHSNGHIQVTPISVKFEERPDVSAWTMRSSDGQGLCREALATA